MRLGASSVIGFRVLLALATIGFLSVISPFLGPILWAMVAAMLFQPIHARLLRVMPERTNIAAALTLFAIVAAVVIPALLIGSALINEAASFAERVRSGQIDVMAMLVRLRSEIPSWLVQRIGLDRLNDLGALRDWIAGNFAASLQSVLGRALNLGQSAFAFVIGLGVMLYMTFFFVRDGKRIVGLVAASVPLDDRRGTALLDRFAAVVHAMIKGSLVVAAVQGLIGGIIFWAIGIPSALLWGVAMGFMSLLPAIGTGIVWVPVALYELATGAIWQGVALILCGLFVIGLVDNLLRPMLVGRDAKMPDYIVFVSTLGGLELFGFNGFILGPVIAGLFLAAWQLHAGEAAPGKTKASAG